MTRPALGNVRLVICIPPAEKLELEREAFERRITVSALVLEERLALRQLKRDLLLECDQRGITLKQLLRECADSRLVVVRHNPQEPPK